MVVGIKTLLGEHTHSTTHTMHVGIALIHRRARSFAVDDGRQG